MAVGRGTQLRNETGLHERGLADAGGTCHHNRALSMGGGHHVGEGAHALGAPEEQPGIVLSVGRESLVRADPGRHRHRCRFLGARSVHLPARGLPPVLPLLQGVQTGGRRFDVEFARRADEDHEHRMHRLEVGRHPVAAAPVADPLDGDVPVAAHRPATVAASETTFLRAGRPAAANSIRSWSAKN